MVARRRPAGLGGDYGRLRVWDAASGTELYDLSGHGDVVNAVAWSPDGARLASGGANGTVQVWDAESGTELRAVSRHSGPVQGVAWSPDGAQLASGGNEGTVRVWDADADQDGVHVVAGDIVSAVHYSPPTAALAVGTDWSVIVYYPLG